jgi:hypothetical protein
MNQRIPHNKKRVEALTRKTSKPHSIPISKLSERSYAARDRALHVLSAMRHDPNLSLTHAAKMQGVKRETVKKYFPSALKQANGKFQATKSDRYTATLYVPDAHGDSIAVKTRSSREREQLGQYLRDLGRYLRGNRDALARWHGKRIAGVELVTAGRAIVAIEPALSDFSLYRAFNGGSD